MQRHSGTVLNSSACHAFSARLASLRIVCGLGTGSERHHEVLAHTNDLSIVGDDIRALERSADVLLNACKDTGLAVNIGKTKYKEVGCHRGIVTNEHIIGQ